MVTKTYENFISNLFKFDFDKTVDKIKKEEEAATRHLELRDAILDPYIIHDYIDLVIRYVKEAKNKENSKELLLKIDIERAYELLRSFVKMQKILPSTYYGFDDAYNTYKSIVD